MFSLLALLFLVVVLDFVVFAGVRRLFVVGEGEDLELVGVDGVELGVAEGAGRGVG